MMKHFNFDGWSTHYLVHVFYGMRALMEDLDTESAHNYRTATYLQVRELRDAAEAEYRRRQG
jgi:hypothetical protein